jgi:Polyketide cyclase / dehydrase and lipid transport
MLKKILLAVLLLILAFAVVVALQPSEFKVARSTMIAAPAADVFPHVNDFHKWEAWSPWAKLDPNAKVSFNGPQAEPGAVMSWAGNDKVGEGKMTLTETTPDDHLNIKVDFVKPFEGSIDSAFGFKPDGGQTQTTWTMTGHHNFMEKAFCLVMNGTKMMAGDLDKGLAQLKSVVEGASGP